MYELEVIQSDGRKYFFSLPEGSIIVGRIPECDIVFNDTSVSRRHVEITNTNSLIKIRDLGSRNGFVLNERKTKVSVLQLEDIVRLGDNQIILRKKEEEILPEDNQIDYQDIPTSEIVKDVTDNYIIKSGEKTLFHPLHQKPAQTFAENKGQLSEFESLALLFRVSERINRIVDQEKLLEEIMYMVLETITADTGVLFVKDEEDDSMIPMVKKLPDFFAANDEADQDCLPVSNSILNRVVEQKVGVLSMDVRDDARFQASESIFSLGITSALCVPMWKGDMVIGAIYLSRSGSKNHYLEGDLDLLTAISHQISSAVEKSRLNEKLSKEIVIRRNLARFHNAEVVEKLIDDISSSGEITPVMKEELVTVSFADIAGFTSLTEQLSPDILTQLLNQYYSAVVEIIFSHKGTIDKFIGDCVMSIFGAPFKMENDAEGAINAALDMIAVIDRIPLAQKYGLKLHVGICTGKAMVGNIGSQHRMEFTALGDTVNIASRLEGMAGENQILIADTTYGKVNTLFEFRKVGVSKLKGKSQQVMVYEVLGREEETQVTGKVPAFFDSHEKNNSAIQFPLTPTKTTNIQDLFQNKMQDRIPTIIKTIRAPDPNSPPLPPPLHKKRK